MPTNRINTICSYVPTADTIADIGADHGKVSAFIYRHGLAKNLIVNDISVASLEKAKRLFSKHKINDNVNLQFICADGIELEKLTNKKIDCAIIAGMGGGEIKKILTALKPKAAILDPRKNITELKESLKDLNYTIKSEEEITDKKRKYKILYIMNNE